MNVDTPRLRTGIDLDGVVVDVLPSWERYLARANHDHEDTSNFLKEYITADLMCPLCFNEILNSDEVTLDADMYSGLERDLHLASLHLDMTVITHRRPTIEAATVLWLQRKKIDRFFREIVVERKSKAAFALGHALHYHVDDSPNVADDFADLPRRFPAINPERLPRLLIIDRGYNQHSPCYKRFGSLGGPGGALEFLIQEGIAYNDLHS